MKVTSRKDQYQQEKSDYGAEIKKVLETRFEDIDSLVENTNPKVLLKIILKTLHFILKKIKI